MAGTAQVLDVVVVHGPPGVGKTALAVDAAHRFAGSFADGCLYLDLRGVDAEPLPADRAVTRLLTAFGVPDARMPSDPADRDRLHRSMMRDRAVLLVLDNAADEAQVRPLLTAAPGSLVLVTSRNVLAGLVARHRVELGPLGRDDAVALLAAVAGDRVAADREAAGAVAGLCGGIPLALAIAGHRLTGPRSLRRLAEQLSDERARLDVLATGDVQVRTAFELSYRLLAPGTAAVFRRLALVPGHDTSVELAAVAAGVPPDDAEALLEELVDASLVRPGDLPGRYTFHDLIRDYARERLHGEEPGIDEHRLRTRNWLMTTATATAALFHPDEQGAADLECADRWLLAEVANWRGALREAVRAGDHKAVLALANAMHWYSDHRGQSDLWLEVYTAGVDAARALGRKEDEAKQLNFVSWVYFARAVRLPAALEAHEAALLVAQECGSVLETAWAHYYRAGIETRRGDQATAVTHGRRAAELFRRAGLPMAVVFALSFTGVVLQRTGRVADAVETHLAAIAEERAVRGTQRGVAKENTAQLLLRLADSLTAAGDPERALTVVAEADALIGEFGGLRAMVRHSRGRALGAAGRCGEAREQFARAAEGMGDPEARVSVLIELAQTCDRMGDHDAATRHRVRALAESEGYESPGMTKLQHDVAEALGIALTA
ncbi:ATP-binding protein [Lentzea chajnantorensis]